MCQIQTFEQAEIATDVGTDVLVVQGNEAGGHTGINGLMALQQKCRTVIQRFLF